MKILFVFPLLFTALTGRATGLKPIESVTVSPLYYGKDSTIIVYSKLGTGSIKVYLSNRLYQDQLIASQTITKSGYTYMYYKNQYTLETNELKVSVKNNRDWETSEPITMTPVADSYRYIVDNQDLVSTGTVHTLSSNLVWSSHNVTYSFTNFDGIYIPDYYHKIKLDDFVINIVSYDRSLFSCTPSLIISNVNGVFNDIATTSTVEFPLELVTTNTGFTFRLKDTIYVHKETLMLSKIAKEGYVPTRHIFLPRNDMQNQDKYKAIFSLRNFGVDKGFVRHNFELRAIKNIIGDCQNSEYCIQRLTQ